ncbi:MAG TPA: hypothetical protein VIW26_00320 [Gemmatimonadales bacterium]|jgi:hypothetical protein
MATGLVSKRCYAAQYHDCDGEPSSREHWITRALLERLRRDGAGIEVTGLAWFDGARASHEDEIIARVLCQRHNSMLSELDDAVIALHDAWLGAAEGKRVDVVIQGEKLERWALKVLLGMITSGAARIDGRKVKVKPPRAVVDVVFGRHELPPPRGFYFALHDERDDELKIKVNIPPQGHPLEGTALGITIQFLAFRFLTYLSALPIADGDNDRYIYRPAGIEFGDNARIEFVWRQGAASRAISINIALATVAQ